MFPKKSWIVMLLFCKMTFLTFLMTTAPHLRVTICQYWIMKTCFWFFLWTQFWTWHLLAISLEISGHKSEFSLNITKFNSIYPPKIVNFLSVFKLDCMKSLDTLFCFVLQSSVLFALLTGPLLSREACQKVIFLVLFSWKSKILMTLKIFVLPKKDFFSILLLSTCTIISEERKHLVFITVLPFK